MFLCGGLKVFDLKNVGWRLFKYGCRCFSFRISVTVVSGNSRRARRLQFNSFTVSISRCQAYLENGRSNLLVGARDLIVETRLQRGEMYTVSKASKSMRVLSLTSSLTLNLGENRYAKEDKDFVASCCCYTLIATCVVRWGASIDCPEGSSIRNGIHIMLEVRPNLRSVVALP